MKNLKHQIEKLEYSYTPPKTKVKPRRLIKMTKNGD